MPGRPVRLKDLKDGMKIFVDDNFDCLSTGMTHTVRKNEHSRFYVRCDEGKHFLDGQVGDFGYLIGIFAKE